MNKTSTVLIFSSILILYASTAMHFGAMVLYAVGYSRLLNDAVSALSSESSDTDLVEAAVTHFQQVAETSSYIASFALAINVGSGAPNYRSSCIYADRPTGSSW